MPTKVAIEIQRDHAFPAISLSARGAGHCYMYIPMPPQAQDADPTIISFFRKNPG